MTESSVARAKEVVEEFASSGVLPRTHDGIAEFLPTFEREFGAPEPTSYRDTAETERLLVREYLRHHDALLWYDPDEVHGVRSYERLVERFLTVGDDAFADATYSLVGEWKPDGDLRLTVALRGESHAESLAYLGGRADHESLTVLFDRAVRAASEDLCLVSVWDEVPVVLFPPKDAQSTVRRYFRPEAESDIRAPDPETDDPEYVYREGKPHRRAEAVRNLGADAAKHSDVVRHALGDDDERVRMAAVDTLVDYAVPGTVEPLAALLAEEDSTLVRRLVPIALSTAEVTDDTRSRVESALEAAVRNDPDEDVRSAAKAALFEVRLGGAME